MKMSLQTHYSGNINGQIPNQYCNPLSGPPQQNGSALPSQTQNPSIPHNASNRNPDFVKARKYVQEKICEILMQRRRQSPELSSKKMVDIVKRLEEGLFRTALSKEEYLNMATLENRLLALIKCPPMSEDNQQFSRASSSLPIGIMIPTPGLSQTSNSTLMGTSVDSSVVSSNGFNTTVSSTFNNRSFLPTGNGHSGSAHFGSLNSYDGPLAGVYQQPNAFSIDSGGINMVSSVGVQKIRSQMIPTPGFSYPNNDGLNDKAINHCPVNLESANNVSIFPTVETSIASQPTRQKPQVGGQNSCARNIGGHMGSGIRSTFDQTTSGLSNGPISGGMGIIGNNISLINSVGTSEHYSTGTAYDNSTQPEHEHEHFDQHHHHPIMQGDGHEISTADTLGSGNFYVPIASVGFMTNNENLNATSSQSMPKINSHLMTNLPSIHFTQQMKNLKTESIDELEKMSYMSKYPVKENVVQCLQHQQLQQPCNQFHGQQVARLQKQQNEDQLLLKKNNFSPSELPSNIVPEYKSGPKKENLNDGLHLQVSEPSEFSDIHNQFQQNSMEDHSRATQLTQSSDQMQQLSYPQHSVNSQNDFKDISSGIRHSGALCDQWHSNSQDESHVSGRLKHDQTVREDFGHGVCGIEQDQRNNICSKESVIGQHDVSGSAEPPAIDKALWNSNYISRERQFKNQQRWILFLLHARRCSAPVGKCQESNCIKAQKLLAHLDCCNAIKCQFPRCDVTKDLLNHRRDCQNASCPVCIPVKKFQLVQRKAVVCSDLRSGLLCTVNGSSKTCDTDEIAGRSVLKTSSVIVKNSEDLEPSCKRRKTEQTSLFFVSEGVRSPSLVTDVRNEHLLQDSEQCDGSHIPVKSESSEIRVENHGSVRQSNHKTVEMKNDKLDDTSARRPVADHKTSSNPSGFGVQDIIQIEKEMDRSKPEKMLISCDTASKSGKPKINGVSLTELFTPEQVRQHIKGLRQWVGQSKAKAEKNQAKGHSMNENSCQLCAVEKLNFEPAIIYCTPCGARIKRNAMYYTFGAGDTRHCFCIPCYNESRGDTIVVDRNSIPKARVEKKKNDDETEEAWVQCDECEAWQHQICALFNGKRNDGGQAYTCPNCYLVEVERGERIPLPQSAVLGAKDLPRTILSDHIEQRLFSRLKHERQERASCQGKAYDEVPGAEALVVRVVSSVDKKVEVKPRFSEIFREQNYPTEFPYKSKVILLFQNIEGVEVCLFGMYVQEYGSECKQPNHRRVYLAYLDSVKYFRPDIRAVTGEALRTFVYHEILIGYLDYCKKRGFTSCYIWACPPMKGEDYILYCHPEIQKTPKSDKLREWYLSMLKKAERENIVVGLTNMYDHFFVCTGESKAKVTAARLPYFDGDYWPGSAEDIIYQLQQEDDGGIKQGRKGFLKKTITKRALKASGQTDLSSNASKDLLLLHKLGGTISTMKEDFIMVHLQHACTHCCVLLFSGNRWVCRQCKKFQLCDMCYDAEQKLEDRERHPVNHKDRHALHPVKITGVPDDTKDKDDILVSEFFDTRQAFLNLCQGNHYQYDTLRRAKHSSMMILYHLHNPTAPAFLATCCVCRLEIEAGQGWHCETCPDYEICNTCYKKGGIDHPHKLTNNPSNDRDVQNAGAMESRVKQLRKMLDLLEHASKCRSPNCQYPNCRGVKGLFLHARMCKKRAVGGCVPCRRMWRILRIHSQACKESECHVPRCRDLRVHMSRVQQQSESRRRAAVMEMMRQRAAEVACSS